MKNKKGQVTIFIIIGILIVAGVVLFFTLREDTIESNTEQVPSEAQSIQTYIQNCLEESVEESIFYISERGGYFEIPSNLESDVFEAPYYIKKGKVTMITKPEMESELSKAIKDNLNKCIAGFYEFEEYEIREGEISVSSSIKDELISIEVSYPLKIIRGDFVHNLKKFKTEKKVRLGMIYEAISQYIQEQEEIPEGFCISCYLSVSEDYDFVTDILDTSEDSKIFLVTDYNTQINDNELIYSFAGEF